MVKKQSGELVRYFLRKRKERALKKLVDEKLTLLKKNGSYKSFPLNEVKPIIANYSFYTELDAKYQDLFYSIYGKPSDGFIPLSAYYNHIEPRLNVSILTSAIKEKNFYDKFLTGVNTPPTLIRRIHGSFFNSKFEFIELDDDKLHNILKGIDAVIIKPSVDSGSGRSIEKFVRQDNKFVTSGKLQLDSNYLKKYGGDFVLQLAIVQHEYFRKFNPESNNTLRVLTYRSVKNEKVSILHTLLRIGSKGSFLDHDNLGGVAISVDDQGKLNDHAFDVHGNKYDAFNDIVFKETAKVPFLDEVNKVSINVANQVHYGRLLAFDFTIDHNGKVLLIEINCKGNGISQYQYNSGSLFKEYTKEILDFCDSRSTKIHILET